MLDVKLFKLYIANLNIIVSKHQQSSVALCENEIKQKQTKNSEEYNSGRRSHRSYIILEKHAVSFGNDYVNTFISRLKKYYSYLVVKLYTLKTFSTSCT